MNAAKPETLWAAICALQADMPEVSKNRTAKGAKFSYRYADISDVLAAVLPALSRVGLALTQETSIIDGGIMLTTRLTHAGTGESVEGHYPVARITDDPQTMGSALTYARRYALCTLIGLAPDDDDDGEATKQRAPAAGRINTTQREQLGALIEESGADIEAFCRYFRVGSLAEITQDRFSDAVSALRRKAEAAQ
jgi:hypothetical protein